MMNALITNSPATDDRRRHLPHSPGFPKTPYQPHAVINELYAPLIQRKVACACGGVCPSCAVDSDSDTSIQTKLVVGEPHDEYEREADQVADYVMSDSSATREPAVESQTGASDGHCTFKLAVKGIEYCFVVEKDIYSASLFKVTAYATNAKAGDTQLSYTADIKLDEKELMEGNRYITNALGNILMKAAGNKTISVPPSDLLKAWNEQFPVGTWDSPWDFVVLEFYDKDKKEFPIRSVFWMGGEWKKLKKPLPPRPDKPVKKIATFRVERGEVKKLVPDYFEIVSTLGSEQLSQDQVNQLIKNKPALESSSFDPLTYVGAVIKGGLADIETSEGERQVGFEQAAGHKPKSREGMHVSRVITNPPAEIQANFKTDQSALPGGLNSASLATFNDQVRLVLLYLQDTPDVDIEIHAYTDTVGTLEDNCRLSQARADSARNYLTDKSIWTGVGNVPKALASRRIIMSQGEGQTLAEEEFKKMNPNEWNKLKNDPAQWKKLIGSQSGANAAYRKFEIKYIPR